MEVLLITITTITITILVIIMIKLLQMADEEKFERTIAILGRLLRDDLQLQVRGEVFGLITWMRGVEVQLKGDGVLCVITIQSFSFQVKMCLRYNDNMDERCGSSIER